MKVACFNDWSFRIIMTFKQTFTCTQHSFWFCFSVGCPASLEKGWGSPHWSAVHNSWKNNDADVCLFVCVCVCFLDRRSHTYMFPSLYIPSALVWCLIPSAGTSHFLPPVHLVFAHISTPSPLLPSFPTNFCFCSLGMFAVLWPPVLYAQVSLFYVIRCFKRSFIKCLLSLWLLTSGLALEDGTAVDDDDDDDDDHVIEDVPFEEVWTWSNLCVEVLFEIFSDLNQAVPNHLAGESQRISWIHHQAILWSWNSVLLRCAWTILCCFVKYLDPPHADQHRYVSKCKVLEEHVLPCNFFMFVLRIDRYTYNILHSLMSSVAHSCTQPYQAWLKPLWSTMTPLHHSRSFYSYPHPWSFPWICFHNLPCLLPPFHFLPPGFGWNWPPGDCCPVWSWCSLTRGSGWRSQTQQRTIIYSLTGRHHVVDCQGTTVVFSSKYHHIFFLSFFLL